MDPMKPRFGFLVFLLLASICYTVESKCSEGCDLALASYYVYQDAVLSSIAQVMQSDPDVIVSYNKDNIPNKDSVQSFMRINVPFRCDCIDGQFLGRKFNYTVVSGDTYDIVAKTNDIKDYGLFITYPLLEEDSLQSIANQTDLDATLLERYNPGVNFSRGSGLVFIPVKVQEVWPSLFSDSLGGGVIAGISVGSVAGLFLLLVCVYVVFYRKKQVEEAKLLSEDSKELSAQGSTCRDRSGASGLTGITVDKSVEFSYEELSKATE
ncbi:putative Receptor protein kinase [Quillaja saponaria]|uniref:Receptor protein kinase n=1 Tax=Quillaja saponaria TaxID=32244 RepID=A0AAD7LVI6_QUISA|nr:putative Receptor protein kinase [Quillaja saponaria]